MAGLVTFKDSGEVVPYTTVSAVSAGDVVVQGELVGVVTHDIAAGESGNLGVSGNWIFPKATDSGSALTAGANVYWNAASQVVTTTASGNKLIGKVVTAVADTATTVIVRMNQ